MKGNWVPEQDRDYDYNMFSDNNDYVDYNDTDVSYSQNMYDHYNEQNNYTNMPYGDNNSVYDEGVRNDDYFQMNTEEALAVDEAVETMAAQQVALKRKKRKRKKIILISISAIVILLIIISIIGSIMSGPPATAVDTQVVEKGNITQTLVTTGTVNSVMKQSLYSPASATVSVVHVQEGAEVQEGDLLISFDTTDLQRAYDTAAANAKLTSLQSDQVYQKSNQAQDSVNQYKSEYNVAADAYNQAAANASNLNAQLSDASNAYNQAVARYNTLNTQNPSSAETQAAQTQMEQLRANMEQLSQSLSEAQADVQAKAADVSAKQQLVEQAQQSVISNNEKQQLEQQQVPTEVALKNAQDSLNAAKEGVKAPFSGIISSVNVQVGQGVAEYAVVCVIQTVNELQVDVPLAQSDLEKVKIGQTAKIVTSGEEYIGAVTSINKIANTGNSAVGGSNATTMAGTAGDVNAVISIDNPDDNIHLNVDAKVTITTSIETNVLKVPLTAVYTDVEGNYCMVMQGDVAVKKQVTVGITDTTSTHIISGLSQGDIVITTSSITDGQKVTEASSGQSTSTSS